MSKFENSENPFAKQEVAQQYDAYYEDTIGNLYDSWEKEAIRNLLPEKIEGNLLDMGCGTGHWSEFFSDLGYSVVGVDNSPKMLEVAEKKELDAVKFELGNAEDVKVSKKFDIVAFVTSLEFVQDPQSAIKNAIQHLKKKGILILGVLNSNSPLAKRRKEDPVYSKGTYYTQEELENIFSPYGKTTWYQCVYLTPIEVSNISKDKAIKLEKKMEQNQKPNGAFIAGRVDVD